MGISSITSTGSMAVTQTTAANVKDQKSKNIQNEITDAQQQIQKLSSNEELSADEKANERKKLQQEVSGLNTKLKQHQEELIRSQKRELMLAKLREEADPTQEETAGGKRQTDETAADTAGQKSLPADDQKAAQPGTVITRNGDGTVIVKEAAAQDQTHGTDAMNPQADTAKEEDVDEAKPVNTDAESDENDTSSDKEMHAMVSAEAFLQQADYQGTVVTRTKDGIAILKGEIKLDEDRDTDTTRKQAELDKMQKQNEREMEFQFSLLGEANGAMQSANGTVQNNTQADLQMNFQVSGLDSAQEEQQRFYVSFA